MNILSNKLHYIDAFRIHNCRFQYNENPENHMVYVYDHFIKRAAAKHVAVVAHSYGGLITVHLVSGILEETIIQRKLEPWLSETTVRSAVTYFHL